MGKPIPAQIFPSLLLRTGLRPATLSYELRYRMSSGAPPACQQPFAGNETTLPLIGGALSVTLSH
jgi:hypothetical protein